MFARKFDNVTHPDGMFVLQAASLLWPSMSARTTLEDGSTTALHDRSRRPPLDDPSRRTLATTPSRRPIPRRPLSTTPLDGTLSTTPLSTTPVVWQDRKHGEKVRLESHFDRVDVNSVDKSGESIIVTKSKCKHCDYLFTTQVSKVKKRALCHLLQVELCAGTSPSMIGLLLQIKEGSLAICNRDLSEPQKDHAGQVHHLI